MRVCYWGTFERAYPRNSVLMAGLRQNGIEVVECHFDLWGQSFRHNKLVLLSGLGRKARFLGRALFGYPLLIWKYLFSQSNDAVIVGYLGHFDIFFLAAFAKIRREPIIFDAFFSIHDAVTSDWCLTSKNSWFARLCYWLDWSACRLATLVLVDTQAQRTFFCREFGLSEQKVRWAYVGADDSIFLPGPRCRQRERLRVVYVGNYVPLHGVPVILKSAQLLDKEAIEFRLIGENHQPLSSERPPECVQFLPWLAPEDLYSELCEADICLGIFGNSEKAKRVIPGKAFIALAMGIPLITGDSPAARELLQNGKNAILCQIGSPQALADSIVHLQRNPKLRRHVGHEGRRLFETRCAPKIVGRQLAELVSEVVGERVTH